MATEIKVNCPCGQKYKFDLESDGQIPVGIQCPICGADGSAAAHAMLQQTLTMQAPIAAAAPSLPRLTLSHQAAPATVAAPPLVAPPLATPYPTASRVSAQPASESSWPEFNMPLGILGAVVGAGAGFAILWVFAATTGIRFPLTGILLGFLTGWAAKKFFRGTDNVLGIASAMISAVAFVASQFVIFGGFGIFNIISLVVSVSFAYKQSSE